MAKKKDKETQKNWSHKNDYPIEEVWNTDNTLAQLIVPRLQAFKALDKHGIIGIKYENGGGYNYLVFRANNVKIINKTKYSGKVSPQLNEIASEIVEPDDVDLSSFNIKKHLNPKFWDNGHLDTRIRLKLLDIADDFFILLHHGTEPLCFVWVDG